MSVKITFGGHSCFVVEFQNHKIIADPFITGNPFSPFKLGSIKPDYAIVTHGHGDHVGDSIELGKNDDCVIISGFEVCNWLSANGVKRVHPIQIGGKHKFPWGEIKMTQALHSSSMPDGSYGGSPAGFILYIDGKKIYHAGDTGFFGDMKFIGEEGIDVAFLPIGDNFTMGPDEAIKAIKFINPRFAMPMHYNTFDVIKQDPKTWIDNVAKMTQAKPVFLKPGESFEII